MFKRLIFAIARLVWRIVRGVLWLVWAIMRPSLRFISAVLLIATVMTLTADVTRWQIGADGPLFLSLAHHLETAAPSTYVAVAGAITQSLHPAVWNYGILPLLSVPAWLLFAVLAGGIAYASREPKRINVFVN